MKCKQRELAFEDYDLGLLSPAEAKDLEEHLAACAQCRNRLEDWRLARKAFSPERLAKPSEAFKARLLKHLHEYPVAPPKSFWTRIRGAFLSPFEPRWAMQALAAALVIVVAIVAYEQLTGPEYVLRRIYGPPATRRADHPIEIFTTDHNRALAGLQDLAAAHGGRVVRRRPVDPGLEVTLRIDEQATPALIAGLPQLGTLTVPNEGYRDGAGDVVVILRPERPK